MFHTQENGHTYSYENIVKPLRAVSHVPHIHVHMHKFPFTDYFTNGSVLGTR